MDEEQMVSEFDKSHPYAQFYRGLVSSIELINQEASRMSAMIQGKDQNPSVHLIAMGMSALVHSGMTEAQVVETTREIYRKISEVIRK